MIQQGHGEHLSSYKLSASHANLQCGSFKIEAILDFILYFSGGESPKSSIFSNDFVPSPKISAISKYRTSLLNNDEVAV